MANPALADIRLTALRLLAGGPLRPLELAGRRVTHGRLKGRTVPRGKLGAALGWANVHKLAEPAGRRWRLTLAGYRYAGLPLPGAPPARQGSVARTRRAPVLIHVPAPSDDDWYHESY